MANEHGCQFCGGFIRFRMIRGVCVPLHDGAELCPTARNGGQPDECRKTHCPRCGDQVYFVRHNGGAVWFEELGQPWEKHPCFDGWQGEIPSELGDAFYLVRIVKVLRYFPNNDLENKPRILLFLKQSVGVPGQWLLEAESSFDEVQTWKNRLAYLNPRHFALRFFDGIEVEVRPHL